MYWLLGYPITNVGLGVAGPQSLAWVSRTKLSHVNKLINHQRCDKHLLSLSSSPYWKYFTLDIIIVTRLMPEDTRSERPEDVARRDLTRRRKSFSRPTLKKRRPPRSNHCCHQTDDEVTLLYIPPTTLSSERANDSTTVIICVFTELCIITIIITCYNNKIWVCNKSYRIFVCFGLRRAYTLASHNASISVRFMIRVGLVE